MFKLHFLTQFNRLSNSFTNETLLIFVKQLVRTRYFIGIFSYLYVVEFLLMQSDNIIVMVLEEKKKNKVLQIWNLF